MFVAPDHRPRGQPRPHRPLAGRRRRRGPAAADRRPRGGDSEPALGARRPHGLLPLHALGLDPGLAHRAARRRGEAAQVTDLPLDVCRDLRSRPTAAMLAFSARGLPRLRRPRVHEEPARRARDAEGDRPDLRPAVRPPLGHLGGRPPQPPLRACRSAGGTPVDVTTGMDADVPSKPFGGSEEITFTPDGKALVFAAQGRRPRGGLVHRLRPLRRPRRRLGAPPQPHRRNPAWDTQPVVLARRQDARLARDGAARLRGRPLPDRAARLARRRRARASPRLGPLAGTSSSGRATAGRSTPPPTTSASTRSSRSTSRPAPSAPGRRRGRNVARRAARGRPHRASRSDAPALARRALVRRRPTAATSCA